MLFLSRIMMMFKVCCVRIRLMWKCRRLLCRLWLLICNIWRFFCLFWVVLRNLVLCLVCWWWLVRLLYWLWCNRLIWFMLMWCNLLWICCVCVVNWLVVRLGRVVIMLFRLRFCWKMVLFMSVLVSLNLWVCWLILVLVWLCCV